MSEPQDTSGPGPSAAWRQDVAQLIKVLASTGPHAVALVDPRVPLATQRRGPDSGGGPSTLRGSVPGALNLAAEHTMRALVTALLLLSACGAPHGGDGADAGPDGGDTDAGSDDAGSDDAGSDDAGSDDAGADDGGLENDAGADGSDGGGLAGTGPIGIDDLAAASRDAVCEWALRCGLTPVPDKAGCLRAMAARSTGGTTFNSPEAWAASFRAGHSTFEATRARLFVEELRGLSCDVFPGDPLTISGYREAFSGRLDAGARCIADVACARGLVCDNTGAQDSCDGSCAPRANGCASDAECQHGFVCLHERTKSSCIAPGPSGRSCGYHYQPPAGRLTAHFNSAHPEGSRAALGPTDSKGERPWWRGARPSRPPDDRAVGLPSG